MIKSLTGFGSASFEANEIFVETTVSSFNSRFLSISVKLPSRFQEMEHKVDMLIREKVSRGRITVVIRITPVSMRALVSPTLDMPLFREYEKVFKSVLGKDPLPDDVKVNILTAFPDVVRLDRSSSLDEVVWEPVYRSLVEAFEELDRMKKEEGKNLSAQIEAGIDRLSSSIERIERVSEGVVRELVLKKLRRDAKELFSDTSAYEEKIGSAMLLLLQKLDIKEEIVRFKSHISQMRKLLLCDEPVGRRLNFLLQELHREATTIAAKSSQQEIIDETISMRAVLEQLREQVQNVE
ncbi:YicC family protein [bacterium]|nr:YicC family protein [bacterium]